MAEDQAPPPVEDPKLKTKQRHYPEKVMAYAEHVGDWDHEGFYWLVLPQHVAYLAAIFGGGGESRALVCERCGLLVGEPNKHNTWHEENNHGD